MFSFAGKKEKKKLDPKAKIRNRGDCCVPNGHPKNKSKKDRYPINNENQARNAIARVNQHSTAPKWWKGSLQELINTVYRCVKSKYKGIELDPKKKKPGKQSAKLILGLYKQAADFLDKKARFEDMDYYEDPDDEEWTTIKQHSPEERMEYYLGGKHPNPQAYINYDDEDLQPEDFELKDPAIRFDPKEHLEGGGSIVGKDDAPYVEDRKGRHYDIYKQDREILEDEEGELDPLGEISDDLPEFDMTPEDVEYLKEKDIDIDEDDIDYESCPECGFNHKYYPDKAQLAHAEIENL